MKKIYFLLVSLCIVQLWSSCTHEDIADSLNIGNHSLVATIEEQDINTRVAVAETGTLTWIDGDAVGIFSTETQNACFSLARVTDDGKSATFIGNLSSKEEQVDYTYYPYQKDAKLNQRTLAIELPAEYTYTGNSFAPMIGVRKGNGMFSFRHTCGLLRVVLSDIPEGAKSFIVTSEGENALDLSGEAEIADMTDGNAELHLKGINQKSVTYHLPNAADKLIFYIPIPVGTYSQLSVRLLKTDGSTFFTRSLSNQVFKRGVMVDLPVLNGYTGDCYVLSEATHLVTKELENKVTQLTDNNSRLLYSNVTEKELPQVGNIVLSRATANLPNGFLGKVISIEKSKNSSYIVNTEVATLCDAFDELYVNETLNIMPTEVPKTRGILNLLGTIWKDWDISKELEISYEHEGNPWSTKGKVGLGAELQVNMAFNKKDKLEYGAFNLTFKLGLDANISLELTAEKELEVIKQKLAEIKLPNIPLAAGLIQIVPVIEPYFVVKTKGEMSTSLGIKTEYQFTSCALYKNGVWEEAKNGGGNKANNESPINLTSSFILKGNLFVGLEKKIDFRFYGADKMKVYFDLDAGLNISGEVDIDLSTTQTVEKILNSVKLNTSLSAGGKLGADASVFGNSAKAEVSLMRIEFWKKEITLLPFFKHLFVKNEAMPGNSLSSNIMTEASGELLMKDAKVALALVDQNKKILKMSKSIPYNGGKTFETDPDVFVPVETTFENLNSSSLYQTCPVVISPLFTNIAKDGKVLLLNQAADVGIAVDLGLSVKWAAWNVGASAPEEYGGLYGWGDPTGTNTTEDVWKLNEDNYMYESWISPLYGGPNPPLNICGTDLDIAHVQWGGAWRLPTRDEQKELAFDCNWEYTKYNGVNGVKITGPNGNCIFLPAAGARSGNVHLWKDSGNYWCGEIWTGLDWNGYYYAAYFITFGELHSGGASSFYPSGDSWVWSRYYGRSVRPVIE